MSLSIGSFLLGIGMPGPAEMMIVLAIVMLLFGGSKLPSLMRNLGRSANEFKRGMSETSDEEEPQETPSRPTKV